MNPQLAQTGLAMLAQPSAGAPGGVGGGGYDVTMTTTATAKSSLNTSGSTYNLGAGDITLGGISSSNITILIIAAAIVAGVYFFRKGR